MWIFRKFAASWKQEHVSFYGKVYGKLVHTIILSAANKANNNNWFQIFWTRGFIFNKTISNGLVKILPKIYGQWYSYYCTFPEDIHARFHCKCPNIPHRSARHKFLLTRMQYMARSSIPLQITLQNKAGKQFEMIALKAYLTFFSVIEVQTAHWSRSNK